MKCCMPLCENASENFSKCGTITFHRFPSEEGLRAAWLRALSIQDSPLPDCAVVCSQHFLHDDICESDSGSNQLRPGAVPSTVLVCMICLDTDSKMSPISQNNLEAAYKKLTGHPLWDGGNLKQTLCVQCAQRLRNFSRFREQSLRARFLMMELLEKHELITIQHIKMTQHEPNKLRNNLVSTTLGPDPCDMQIVENSDESRQDSEETVLGVAVKSECSNDSQREDVDTQMIIKENADSMTEEFTIEKYESAEFVCTVCCEQFPHEHAYSAHVRMHLHSDEHPVAPAAHSAVTPLSATATNRGDEAGATEAGDTTQHGERALVTDSGASANLAPDSDHGTNTYLMSLMSCVVELYDIMKYPQNANIKFESSPQTLQGVSSRDSLNAHTVCDDAQYRAASEDEVATTHNKPHESVLSETEPSTSGYSSGTRTFTCNVCKHAFTQKDHFVTHMRTHTSEKPYSCEICSYKYKLKSSLVKHMRTHASEKPYSCEICCYKFKQKSHLVEHMRTHTGEKPYYCEICSYKCAKKNSLVTHMRTHTGEKPYSCEICCYKFTQKSSLVTHMRTHTGEKPYSCEICSYKCAKKNDLVPHMRTHTGEKPYSCEICCYKFTQKSRLVEHMRTHSGEKPYSCEICSYKYKLKGSLLKHMRTHASEKPYPCEICCNKFTQKSRLVEHMRTHTGEKPYSCEICSYKYRLKGSLLKHMRTHASEKPYPCEICCYKFTQKSSLVEHMRTHTGEKPYSCEICSYKCAKKNGLVTHMRTHTGEKPYSCEICSYKCAEKNYLVPHMRTHTGEKPYSCEICSYKCTKKSNLVAHMWTHTGEKPYSCKICEHKFRHKSHLTQHLRTHTGEKPYSCQVCSYKGANKGYLIKHMRTHTGEKPYSVRYVNINLVKRVI